jgi:hypothetical protein
VPVRLAGSGPSGSPLPLAGSVPPSLAPALEYSCDVANKAFSLTHSSCFARHAVTGLSSAIKVRQTGINAIEREMGIQMLLLSCSAAPNSFCHREGDGDRIQSPNSFSHTTLSTSPLQHVPNDSHRPRVTGTALPPWLAMLLA